MNLKARFAQKMFGWLLLLICSLFLLGGLFASHATAATLNVDDISGELLGASNVSVDGQFYDVVFIEGSADSIWGPVFNFAFDTMDSALAASQALLDGVLTDTTLGMFDTIPDLTFGIERPTQARILTPFSVGSDAGGTWVGVGIAMNLVSNDDDTLSWTGMYSDHDITTTDYMTYAKWSETSAVPIPSALSLLGLGCLSLVGYSRRRKE